MATNPDSQAQQVSAPTPSHAAQIKAASLKFLRWAHEHSLLKADAYYPGETVEAPDFGEKGFSATALSVLRQKQIRFVGVNSSASEILVYLHRAAPSTKALSTLPAICDGFALRYRQGDPQSISPLNVAEATNTGSVHTSPDGSQQYTCGSSISVGNSREAGTLGCLLRDASGALFGLSNNHVSGSCNYAPAGLPIVAPGILDVSPANVPPFTLGYHSRQLPMLMGDPTSVDATANQDAAVFEIRNPTQVSSMQQGHYDTPSQVMDLVPGMEVQKVGRTSEFTRGIVQAELIGAMPVCYAAPQYNFTGAVYFEPMYSVFGIGDRFSDGGDSGSLVTHLDANGVRFAVGIVVAGATDNAAPGAKISLIMPIRPILERLGLTLVSQHNA